MNKKSVSCSVETTLAIIGGLWKVLILREQLGGTKRFNELHRALAGVTHRTLTHQLRELEAHRVMRRKVYLRPGGLFHYCLRSPDGHDMWGKFVYREIIAPERLVFVVSFSNEQAGITRHPASPTWPLEVLSTLTLAEHEGRTTFTMRG